MIRLPASCLRPGELSKRCLSPVFSEFLNRGPELFTRLALNLVDQICHLAPYQYTIRFRLQAVFRQTVTFLDDGAGREESGSPGKNRRGYSEISDRGLSRSARDVREPEKQAEAH